MTKSTIFLIKGIEVALLAAQLMAFSHPQSLTQTKRVHRSRGKQHGDRQSPSSALEYYNQALPLRRATQDQAGEASTLTNIGVIYKSKGDSKAAADYFKQALYAGDGDYDRAVEYLDQTLSAARQVGDTQVEATALAYLGDVHAARKDTARALIATIRR